MLIFYSQRPFQHLSCCTRINHSRYLRFYTCYISLFTNSTPKNVDTDTWCSYIECNLNPKTFMWPMTSTTIYHQKSAHSCTSSLQMQFLQSSHFHRTLSIEFQQPCRVFADIAPDKEDNCCHQLLLINSFSSTPSHQLLIKILRRIQSNRVEGCLQPVQPCIADRTQIPSL